MDSQPIEDKEEINFAIKANDVDLLRRLPPPPTYTESPPYTLLPPSRRDESRILDLDRAKVPIGWDQKRVKRAKLYDSRIEKSRKKWDIDEFLYNPKWRILLFLQAPASLEVTIEFLCSLRFHNDGEEVKSTAEVTSTTKVTFTLMGRLLSLTVVDLGWLIGLYTLDETRSLAFANLPDQLDPEFDVRKFWQAHGGCKHIPTIDKDSVDSRLRSMETLLLTQQWQVEEILEYTREQGTKKAEHGAGPKQGKCQG
ncbi:unnamed protein product [Cuscuta campestris]|uniref:Uncharacterized protein n=1 Tax=Cuscuta campestris TaxID=132261 RepID=A0A484N6A4_9ASTE|nr:unnamed protein product [Cuscuta campestris]